MLLTEMILPEMKPLLVENDQQGRFVYLKGLFIQGDVQNHNGRNYPRDEIGRAVAAMKQKIAERGPVPGELDHPEGLNINFDRISHVITDINMEGPNGVGTMRVINEGLGKVVRGCVEAGMQIGVSSRGSGNVDGSGRVSDFAIVTIDIVANPSAPKAFPGASLAESILRNKHGAESVKLSEALRDDAGAQKYLSEEFNRFLVSVQDEFKFGR